MKFFENNLKERFQNITSFEGVNVDELWDDIAPVITEEEETQSLSFRFWAVFLVVCFLLFYRFFFF